MSALLWFMGHRILLGRAGIDYNNATPFYCSFNSLGGSIDAGKQAGDVRPGLSKSRSCESGLLKVCEWNLCGRVNRFRVYFSVVPPGTPALDGSLTRDAS